ncbi:unnamed protein product [Pneumocystis jirovecii]|uniref:Probable vacuolar protein sorting-associated protein 16 homolog n=2 Tax=Pneumocystis jirovecii TaxID=42068 RepID=L0PAE9_PNEJI|nr:tethering complex subunit VPS16 [Pneumocystis jirovecii RU7]KTW32584.1 hypothetical protein T551_00069 [Pneumocystis jirovecii RU7]CCJ28605.1 unnamed protein product [Pneumocystis jirovecii]
MKQPTEGWVQLSKEKFYQKIELSIMLWKGVELSGYISAGALYGGAIALVRDDRVIHKYLGPDNTKSNIRIYNSYGAFIREIHWDIGKIRGLGWSDSERLIVVTEDGIVRNYNIQGEFTQFSLGKEINEHLVINCQFWGTGFVALLENNTFIAVNSYDEPRPRVLCSPEFEDIIHSWTIIAPQFSSNLHVEVLVSTKSTIYIIDEAENTDQCLQQGPFLDMSVSPNGQFLALHTFQNKIWVISTGFQRSMSEFTLTEHEKPLKMGWCGNDSVIILYNTIILMIGPFGGFLSFPYNGPALLISEIDGVRIITSDKCEFLQKVPDDLKNVYKTEENSYGAILLKSIQYFDQESSKIDENIQSIKPYLAEAVDQCIKAAGYEFDPFWQKRLLKAASFGKSYLNFYNPEEFVEMCEILRVLNSMRFYDVGIPLTFKEYFHLTPEGLIERLITRQKHFLALKICEYLRLPSDKIYTHWACMKIKHSVDDEETIYRVIIEKLILKKGVSFEEIARTACDEGKQKLAVKLLDYTLKASNKIHLLLSIRENETALIKAIESGDVDLVLYVILYLKDKLPLAHFFQIIRDKAVAVSILETYAKEHDSELLKDFYYQDDRRSDGANVILLESLRTSNIDLKIEKLKLSVGLYKEYKDFSFEIKNLEEHITLLELQQTYEKEFHELFIGLSINETVFKLIKINQMTAALKIKSDFKIPIKRFWWLKLRALVAIRDWTQLEDWANKSKKSPIGYEPFVSECLAAGNKKMAANFIPKCSEITPTFRAELWAKAGDWISAGSEALKYKNLKLFEDLKSKAPLNIIKELEKLTLSSASSSK